MEWLDCSFFLLYATIVAFSQSNIGEIVFHNSVPGTSFHRMAFNEYANGENSGVTEI
jgi:hypothetical protein